MLILISNTSSVLTMLAIKTFDENNFITTQFFRKFLFVLKSLNNITGFFISKISNYNFNIQY